MYNSHITDPGEWLWFSQRDENKSLTMEQKTQKFLHETSLYQEFLSFQVTTTSTLPTTNVWGWG